MLSPPLGRRGFPDYPEAPRLLIDKKLGSPPRDLNLYHEYWLISDRMKEALEAVDPPGCAFVRCEVYDLQRKPTEIYWLCDVLRLLDAIDESASRLHIEEHLDGRKIYDIRGASLIFRPEAVGSAHIFRLAFSWPAIFCDQALKDTCRGARLKGIAFADATKL